MSSDKLMNASKLLAVLDHVHALADLAHRAAASVVGGDMPGSVRAFDNRFKQMISKILEVVGVDPDDPGVPGSALGSELTRVLGAAGDLIVDVAGFTPVGGFVRRTDGGVHGERVLPGVQYGKEVLRIMRIQPNDPAYSAEAKKRAVKAAQALGWPMNNGNTLGAVTMGPQVDGMPCGYDRVFLAAYSPAEGA